MDKQESKVPTLYSLTGGTLLDMLQDSLQKPLLCLYSLKPVKWNAPNGVVRFACGPECTHPPFFIQLPIRYGDSWLEIQTFKMPEEKVSRLVEVKVGKNLVTVSEELPFEAAVCYWAKVIRTEVRAKGGSVAL